MTSAEGGPGGLPGPGPGDRLDYATLLVEAGELYDAEGEVTEALARRPDDLRALDLAAKIKHMRGELSEAIAGWGELHARIPEKETAQVRLASILMVARESARGGAGDFLLLGANQLWRKPAAYLELEAVFRLFLARQPDEARARCDGLARTYKGRDGDLMKLAVLAKAWISELSGDGAGARAVLEQLGRERGFESDPDRLSALARLYERDGTRELLVKALNIYRHFEGQEPRVSVVGHLARLHRQLGHAAEAAACEARFLALFRRRMHRPTLADASRIAASRYVPLHKLCRLQLADPGGPATASPRERALAAALRGDLRAAAAALLEGKEGLDLLYRADLAVLSGETAGAVRLYLEGLESDPEAPRVVGWLLEQEAANPSAEVEAYFRRPDRGPRAAEMLAAEVRESSLRPSLWRQLAVLHTIRGQEAEAERALGRAAALEEAASRRRSPVGRVLAAAVYHFGGKARGLVHEVWAARRPVGTGRGGFLDEVLGNLTPEMTLAVKSTFYSVREYARALWPELTRDILDHTYTFKVTKDDEPSGGVSAGLPTALAFLSVFLDLPVPQDVAASGALVADSHDVLVVRPIGEAEHKVRGAYNRNLPRLLLPEGNRAELLASPLVPAPICHEIVRFVGTFDEAAALVFGEDVRVR